MTIEIDTGADPKHRNLHHQQVTEQVEYSSVDTYKGNVYAMTSTDFEFLEAGEWSTLNGFLCENTGDADADEFSVIWEDSDGSSRTVQLEPTEFIFTDSVQAAAAVSTQGTVTGGSSEAYFWASGAA